MNYLLKDYTCPIKRIRRGIFSKGSLKERDTDFKFKDASFNKKKGLNPSFTAIRKHNQPF